MNLVSHESQLPRHDNKLRSIGNKTEHYLDERKIVKAPTRAKRETVYPGSIIEKQQNINQILPMV